MMMMTGSQFLDSLPKGNKENLKTWLYEVSRGLRSDNRLELFMHQSWWQCLSAMYHASWGVDEAGRQLVVMQLHANLQPKLSFREVVEEQLPKTKKATRVKKHDVAGDVVEEGGKHDLPIA